MDYSFPDQVPTNVLTINTVDPASGTAELKACAVNIEKACYAAPGGIISS